MKRIFCGKIGAYGEWRQPKELCKASKTGGGYDLEIVQFDNVTGGCYNVLKNLRKRHAIITVQGSGSVAEYGVL